jgi:hypothetical protein
MAAVFRKLGFQVRIVYVFDTDANAENNLRSHTFVDVMNPASGRWESQDPDYDIFWRSAVNEDRVSVFAMAEDPSLLMPCDTSRCGWELVSDENQKVETIRSLIDIVSVVNKPANQRTSHFTSRADPNRVFVFGDRRGTFCEIMTKLCRDIEGAGRLSR